ncbi:class I SAM-dependent methyltransferase, partial [Parabacteroides johnsonii]|uniref:class I SAM-dependent methyltransferase n=1 Tax=Parabacteroides johnsonii TaxID=387661 RepID=UPI00242CDD4C
MDSKANKCRICGNDIDNREYTVRKNMFHIYDEFLYFKCANCGCLQIKEYPTNISKYYPSDYYSFSRKKKTLHQIIVDFLMKCSLSYRINRLNLIGLFAIRYNDYYKYQLPCFDKGKCDYSSKILDIGCGAGTLLMQLRGFGFSDLTGIDPFISTDIIYSNGVRIWKKDIYGCIGQQYDCIMLHHSFEHMTEPRDVFAKLKNMLSDKGRILIRIPLCDSYAWRKYNTDWWQLDAPRHFYLHTVKSISLLSAEFGLQIENIYYDSHEYQFIGSQMYRSENKVISRRDMGYYKGMAALLNVISDGDQACFVLK